MGGRRVHVNALLLRVSLATKETGVADEKVLPF